MAQRADRDKRLDGNMETVTITKAKRSETKPRKMNYSYYTARKEIKWSYCRIQNILKGYYYGWYFTNQIQIMKKQTIEFNLLQDLIDELENEMKENPLIRIITKRLREKQEERK